MAAVAIAPMELAHLDLWETEIQPAIREMPDRADADWRWRTLAGPYITASPSFQSMTFAAMTLGVSSSRFIPCGLLLLIKNAPYLRDQRRRSTYVWYLTRAPSSVLGARGLLSPAQIPKFPGVLLLDAAICISLNSGWEGRVGLHAAPEGGDKLLRFYTDNGMLALDAKRPAPKALRALDEPDNDGRFFFHDENTATSAIASANPWR
jgi:hypothetical protein